ncbi:MAG: rhodanese-like domain-containing protein [Sulfurimicrobium sp.]|nr:rhodanese-like domain-containing protein [Sulfurimicrobium sp.]
MDFIQNNLGLVALVIVSGLMIFWPMVNRRISGIKEVGILEATQLINHHDALVLDVREDQEYAGGRIPQSKHIPLRQLSDRLHELEKFKNKPIIAICRSGARSGQGCSVLRKNGFEQVYNLNGGITSWQQANMPVERK